MTVTLVTLAILACTTSMAIAATLWTVYRGLPASVTLQGPERRYGKFRQRLPLIGFNLTCLVLGIILILPFFEDAFRFDAPGWFEIVVGPLLILLVDDTFFYGWHRLLHRNKYMYRKIHRLHHKAYAPLPLDFIYAHPVEWTVGSMGPVIGVAITHVVTGGISVWSFWLFTFIRQVHEINLHTGARSVLLAHLPNISTTDSHDHHHARPNDGNYSSMFEHWDRIMGTKYKRQKAD